MTSKNQKGKDWVLEAMDLARAAGYTVWKPGNKAHFIGKGRVVSQSQDILEAADFIAVARDTKVLFVQVTGYNTGDIAERKTKLDNVPFNMDHVDLYVLGRVKGTVEFVVWWKTDSTGWKRIENRRKVKDKWVLSTAALDEPLF